MNEWITVQFDGGSRGNPGPAGIGVVLRAEDDTPVFTLGRFIGRATNNVAEYTALVTGLEEARRLGATKVAIRGDSELVIKQMKGEYRVKHPDMKVLYDQAQRLLRDFEQVKIEHNLRHKNELADHLANLAMDRRKDVLDADAPPAKAGAARAGTTPAPSLASRPEAQSPLDAPSPVAPQTGDRHACPRCGCVIRIDKPTGVRPHQLKPFACQCGTRMLKAPDGDA